jgi:MarR family 2-MHQ and catechol resistance regulon transcriptional repressor
MEKNEKLLSVIFNVGRLIREEIHASNCLANFTHAEVEVLKFLHNKKNITMKAIADYLYIKPSSATPVVDKLSESGNIKRVENKDDRRVVYIELTLKGKKTLEKKYKTIHKTIDKIFGKLNEKDKKILIKIFEKINNENI